MGQETTELKAVVTVETRAEAQIDRLEKKIKSLAGAANSTFKAPLDTTTKQAQLISKAFEKHRGDMQDFGRAQRDWANSIYRQGKMTVTLYDELEKSVRSMITAQGQLRKGADEAKFIRAVRTLNAYAYVWNRHHDTYVRNLRQQDRLQAQIEDKRLYLAQRATQAFERGEKRRADSAAALDRQRSRAFLAAENEKESARRALERQRSRAYIAQIRTEEAAGRKAEANKIREQLRAQREAEKLRRADERAKLKVAAEQESARRALERQRSRAYIAQIREQERLGQRAEAERVREALRQQRMQESSRRAIERQRSRAYIAEIREQERLGRKAEADKIREKLRQERSQESSRRALERQRSQAYIKEIRDQERAGRKAEADKIREQLRQQRSQESARRALDRQRTQAYTRELREQAGAEAKNARYIQQLKNNSWIMQMRQDEQARRAQERAARSSWRQFGVDGKQSLRGLGIGTQSIGSALNRTGVIAMYGGAAAGAASAAAQRGVRSRMSVEAAETELRMFGGELARPGKPAKPMTAADVAGIRSEWLDEAAIGSGVSATTGLNVLTEVIKAGIDPAKSREMTELVLGASAGMDMNTRETTRVLGRAATNIPNVDSARMKKIMTGMAIAAAETAADPDEIVSGMDRGMGALSYGMSPEDLAAWVAVGRSTGIQAAKSGNFIATLLSKGVNAKNLRGKPGRDMDDAARMLGMGSARGMSRRASADPNQFLEDMFEKVESMSVDKRAKLSNLMGGQEWDDEILQMKQGLQKLKEVRAAMKDERNKNFLEDNKDLKNNSLRGLWARMRARFGLLWETFGDGFTSTFEEVSRWFIISGRAVNLGGLRTIGASFMTGLVNGLGFENWTALLNKYFNGGQFDWGDINDKVQRFAKGFGKGLKAVYDNLQSILGMVPGSGKMDAESLGEMTAKLVGFALGVQAGKPAWDLLGIVKDGLIALAGGVIFLNGALGLLGLGGIKGLGGKALGVLGARTFAGAAGAVGSVAIGEALGTVGVGASLAAIAAGGILIAGLAAGVAAIAVTIMNWDAIKEWFKPYQQKAQGNLTDKEFQDNQGLAEGLNAEADPLARAIGRWLKSWFTKDATPAQRRQMSFSGDGDFRSMLHYASFEASGLSDLKHSVDKMGAKFELAALTGPGIAAGSHAMLGSTGTGTGSGSTSYGLPQYSIPNSDPAQRYGKRFFSVPGGLFDGRGNPSGIVGYGANPGAYKPFLDYIAGTEGTAGGKNNGYDVTLANGKLLPGGKEQDLTKMTLDQIDAMQTGMLNNPNNRWNSSAAGRYQIVRKTLRNLRRQLGLKGNELFDEAMQDRLGATLAQQRGANGSLGSEWASLRGGKLSQAIAILGQVPKDASTTPGARPADAVSGLDQFEGLRLKSREAIAGGATALGITDLARQAQANLPGGVARFSSFNDAYHHGANPNSKHTQGLAFDTSLNDPRQHAAAAEAMREKLRAAGLDENAFKVIDEYANPSGHATGGHIHTQFNTKEAAQKYHDYVAALDQKAKAVVASNKVDGADGMTSTGWKSAGWKQENGGPWINKATGQEASPEKAAELNKKMADWDERKKRMFGRGRPRTLADDGFTGVPFGASKELIDKAKDAANGGGAAATANGAPSSGAERMIKNVPAPSVGGGQGGGGGGSAPQIHVTQHINGWEKSPKEIADMSQKHITEAWNHPNFDLEPGLG
jgi:muramidase (phage lysozyme)